MKVRRIGVIVLMAGLAVMLAFPLRLSARPTAQESGWSEQCSRLPSHAELTEALKAVVAEDNGGFGLHMWATLVNRDGAVCGVTFSGADRGDQWPGSRVISAQKANTANAFSLPGLALSTANLFTAVQPGNSLYGLQFSNPVDTAVAYGGDGAAFGQEQDPMVGQRIGGVNVFGGGLALYRNDGLLLGALGVSGDSSCTDHIIAWKVRDALGLDAVPGGVSETGDDNIVYTPGSGWAHPECGLGEVPISQDLPSSHAISLKVSPVLQLDAAAGEFPEGIAVDQENNVYLGIATTGEIRKVTPAGEVSTFAQLPSPGDGFMLGMAFDGSGSLYVGLASFALETSGVYRVSPDGATVDRVAALDPEGMPNAMDFDSAGNLYVSNTTGGQVWKIDPQGSVSVWIEDPLLLGILPPQPPLNIPLGANGIAIDAEESYLYVAVTEMGRIVRVPVNADGSAGAPEVFAEDGRLGGADGITFDDSGNLYAAVISQDSILKLSPDGAITVLAQGGAVRNPASLDFGKGEEAETLYITDFEILRGMELMPGTPQPAIVKMARVGR